MAKNKSMSKKKAGAIGLVAGVAAGAAALALSDKNNRKKVKRALEDVKDKAVDVMEDVEKTTRPIRKEAKIKLGEVKKTTKKQMVV